MKKNLNFSQKSLHDFLNDLGSTSSTPGGGAAAALMAATGTALLEMVAGFNEKRRKKNGLATSASKGNILRLKKIRLDLLKLMTQDARAFERVLKFKGLDKKSLGYQNALKKSAGVPMEICRKSVQALSLSVLETKEVSRWLVSDLNEAGLLLESAFQAARLNVEVNFDGLMDEKFILRTKRELIKLNRKIHHLSASS